MATKHCTRRVETRWGRQPAWEALRRWADAESFDTATDREALSLAARYLSADTGREVKPQTLRAWLDGYNTPPAEIKIGLAEVLCVAPADCWTADVLAATYCGPRGFGGHRS